MASETGAWSAAVEGMQGRLVVSPGTLCKRTRLPNVYLELRNVSDVGSPKDAYYGSGEGLTLEVVDAQGKSIPRSSSISDEVTPLPFRVVLPFDSALRFRVSLSGYGIPQEAGLFLEIGGIHGPVFLPQGTPKAYFLRGTFTAAAGRKSGSQDQWRGTLILPGVALGRFAQKPPSP